MKRTLTSKDLAWHVLAEPSAGELAEFVRETGLQVLDAEFVAQERQRPEVAVRDHYILFLLQIPVFERHERVTSGINVCLVIREDAVFTLSFEPLVALEQIFEELGQENEKQEEYFSGTSLLLALYILRRLFAMAFLKLDRLAKHIDIAEDAVFHGNERKMVEEIALLTRDVMDFRKIIRPQRRLFRETPRHAFFTAEAGEQWRRVSAQMAKLWDILNSLAEAVRHLGKTNFALLQHKENQLLRLISFYTIITIPILVLASPFNSSGGKYQVLFWSVFFILLMFLGLVFFWAKRKKVL